MTTLSLQFHLLCQVFDMVCDTVVKSLVTSCFDVLACFVRTANHNGVTRCHLCLHFAPPPSPPMEPHAYVPVTVLSFERPLQRGWLVVCVKEVKRGYVTLV